MDKKELIVKDPYICKCLDKMNIHRITWIFFAIILGPPLFILISILYKIKNTTIN